MRRPQPGRGPRLFGGGRVVSGHAEGVTASRGIGSPCSGPFSSAASHGRERSQGRTHGQCQNRTDHHEPYRGRIHHASKCRAGPTSAGAAPGRSSPPRASTRQNPPHKPTGAGLTSTSAAEAELTSASSTEAGPTPASAAKSGPSSPSSARVVRTQLHGQCQGRSHLHERSRGELTSARSPPAGAGRAWWARVSGGRPGPTPPPSSGTRGSAPRGRRAARPRRSRSAGTAAP